MHTCTHANKNKHKHKRKHKRTSGTLGARPTGAVQCGGGDGACKSACAAAGIAELDSGFEGVVVGSGRVSVEVVRATADWPNAWMDGWGIASTKACGAGACGVEADPNAAVSGTDGLLGTALTS